MSVIVTNGGGPGILAMDAASKYGLLLPEISPETVTAVKPHLKHNIKMNNPMDTTAAALPEFEGILQELAADKGSDAVLFIFVRPAMLKVEEVEAALHRVAAHFRRNKKPLLVCSMGHTGLRAEIDTTGKFIPSYVFPENAVAALAKAVEYSERLARPESSPVKLNDINREEASKIIAAALDKKLIIRNGFRRNKSPVDEVLWYLVCGNKICQKPPLRPPQSPGNRLSGRPETGFLDNHPQALMWGSAVES